MKVQCLSGSCKNLFTITRKESLRAARPKCPRCGNGQLEEIKKPEKEEREEVPQETEAVA